MGSSSCSSSRDSGGAGCGESRFLFLRGHGRNRTSHRGPSRRPDKGVICRNPLVNNTPIPLYLFFLLGLKGRVMQRPLKQTVPVGFWRFREFSLSSDVPLITCIQSGSSQLRQMLPECISGALVFVVTTLVSLLLMECGHGANFLFDKGLLALLAQDILGIQIQQTCAISGVFILTVL